MYIKPIAPTKISAYTATSALGRGKAAMLAAVKEGLSGLRPLTADDCKYLSLTGHLATWVGCVEGLDAPLPESWARWDCRNNRLAWLGLQADGFLEAVADARRRHGSDRVAVVMGTTTGSIGATESAYQARTIDGHFPEHMHNAPLHTLHALGAFVQEALALDGPCFTLSTACSSSAKAFCSAERLLRVGVADAVVVGGVDTLCGSTLFGFHALQLVSPDPCEPFGTQRRGLNLGEAAGFALLEKGPGALQLLGHGESSDAHHLSAPHPQGRGAEAALDGALARAGLDADAVDFLHLHGTATPLNDDVEAALVNRRFGVRTHASSTKGMVGHTLGAAGMMGSTFSLLAIETGLMPGTVHTREVDPACGTLIRRQSAQGDVRVAATHAFGFGGSNCVLVWGRGEGGSQPLVQAPCSA
ncbi:beta-ketoacyl-ACP synthase [Hydrogenophaga sp.]|uniref:beta-ketoacyl-ACP synthase n=1 Tax=Hydrogenophaga sp. TaxID=1904254 RepID=UPI00351EC6F7